MDVNVPLLVLSVLLLWLPRRGLRFGFIARGRRRRSSRNAPPWQQREPGDPRLSLRRELFRGRNHLDFLRAFVGTAVLLRGWGMEAAVRAESGSPGAGERAFLVHAAMLMIAVVIQTCRVERGRLTMSAPVFFFGGISVALCDPRAGLFAFVAIWAVNPMLPNGQAFLAMYAVFVGAFAMLFRSESMLVTILAVALPLMPVVVSLLLRRPLVVFSRKAEPSELE